MKELALTRTALGNLVAALMRKQPPLVDQPDIELALREAQRVLGFPFVESKRTEPSAASNSGAGL